MDQVDEIKQKTDIVAIIGERVELKKAGRNYKGLCPFHSEKTPSFMVSPELQIYKCFGCQLGGDCIQFLMEFEGMEFREALKFLADRVGVKLISVRPGEEGEKERLFRLNSLASRFFNYILLNHRFGRAPLDYLVKERGISLELIKLFQLGFSPETAGALSSFLINKKKFTLRDLERAGLVVIKNLPAQAGGKSFDRFRGRIIFPLFDHKGKVVGFAGRTLPWQKSDLAKYINTPETIIYHKGNLLYGLNLAKEEIKRQGEAIVVEGELDTIASVQAGVANTVAIKGSALTADQVRLLSRFTKKIILALDADFAGDVAARRGVGVAQGGGLEIKVARLGKYKDPAEAARKNPQEFKKILTESVGVWDFLIDSVFNKFDSRVGEGKLKISQEVVPILASIPDKIVQAHYVQLTAKKLSVPVESVFGQLQAVSQEEKGRQIAAPVTKSLVKSRRQLLEERLLALAFSQDPRVLLAEEILSLFTTPLAKRILEEYVNFSKDRKEFSASLFAGSLPKELFTGFAEMVLVEKSEVEQPHEPQKEFNLVKRQLEILSVRHDLELFGAKIRKYEDEGKDAMLRKSQAKFSELSQKLSLLEQDKKGGIIQYT